MDKGDCGRGFVTLELWFIRDSQIFRVKKGAHPICWKEYRNDVGPKRSDMDLCELEPYKSLFLNSSVNAQTIE